MKHVGLLLTIGLGACIGPTHESTPDLPLTEPDPVEHTADTALQWGGFEATGGLDTGFASEDTAAWADTGNGYCLPGELLDCNGHCFPDYFVGDGVCDDATTFRSDFDCATYQFDLGDCGTPVPDANETCLFQVHLTTDTWPGEMSWELEDSLGNVIISTPPNHYALTNTTYGHLFSLPPGEYELVMKDSFGDGWSAGANWRITHLLSGVQIAEHTFQGSIFPFGAHQRRRDVTLSCDLQPEDAPDTCDLTLSVVGADQPERMGWDLRDQWGVHLDTVHAGDLTEVPEPSEVSITEGRHYLTATASSDAGWAGGQLHLTDAQGELAAIIHMETRLDMFAFDLDCDTLAQPVQFAEIDCLDVEGTVQADPGRLHRGWSLYNADFERVGGADPGDHQYPGRQTQQLPDLSDGTWYLEQRATDGQGWGTVEWKLRDSLSDEVEVSVAMDAGFYQLTPIEITCTPPGDVECAAGAVQDCNGICFPTSYIGDGFCDDGVLFASHFDCATHEYDDGDCD